MDTNEPNELNETNVAVELPDNFHLYDSKTQQLVLKYLASLDKLEQLAYTIGKEHLGTSFNVLKSNGYNSWLKKQN